LLTQKAQVEKLYPLFDPKPLPVYSLAAGAVVARPHVHLRAGAIVRRHNARRRAEGVCGGLIGAVRFPESIREDLSAGAIGRGLLAPEAASRGTVVREELAGTKHPPTRRALI